MPKRFSPLDFIFTPAPRPLQVTFFVGEAEHLCLYPFARANVSSAKKTHFLQFGRAHHVLSLDEGLRCGLNKRSGLAMRLFSCGARPTFEDHPQVFSQKRFSPLDFIFDICASASSSHFFWLVKLSICACILLQAQIYFSFTSIPLWHFFPHIFVWGSCF